MQLGISGASGPPDELWHHHQLARQLVVRPFLLRFGRRLRQTQHLDPAAGQRCQKGARQRLWHMRRRGDDLDN